MNAFSRLSVCILASSASGVKRFATRRVRFAPFAFLRAFAIQTPRLPPHQRFHILPTGRGQVCRRTIFELDRLARDPLDSLARETRSVGPEDSCPHSFRSSRNSAPGHGLTLAEQGGGGSVISSVNRATAQPFGCTANWQFAVRGRGGERNRRHRRSEHHEPDWRERRERGRAGGLRAAPARKPRVHA